MEAGYSAAGADCGDDGAAECSGGVARVELPKIIFAALDADIARELEPKFAAAGCAVISNSSAFRMVADVPLVVPEVNADHLALIEAQSWRKENGGGGYIVTNPNCSAIGLVLALKPLEERFGIESLFVSTMQAVSGAGYPGVASLDILGNVVPFIKNEEEKLQEEVGKLLGRLDGSRIEMLDAKVSAHCNRVAVEDGHTECVSIKFKEKATREEILAAWSEFAAAARDCICRRLRSSRWSLTRAWTGRSRGWTGCAGAGWRRRWDGCASALCWTGSSWCCRTIRFAGRRGRRC